jgi:hypothetical protein
MNRSFKLVFGLGLLALFAAPLAGCAAEDEDMGMPKYPEAVGYDAPAEPPPDTTASANQPGLPPNPPPAPPAAPIPLPDSTGETGDTDGVAIGADDSQYADTDPSALTDFHTALDPYGSWVDDPTYGTVWSPSDSVVGSDFSPYVSNGSWTYDDYGQYVWVSDYDWGWAPFHYGRWAYLGTRWGWIPGRTYAGAWVSWRYGGGYVGWAPLPPTWYWRGGYAFGLGHVPYAPYSFCGAHDVFNHNIGGRVVTGANVGAVASHTQPYVPAHPTVGGVGRTPGHPTVGGPSPSSLGLGANEIAHTPANNVGVAHAQTFARPGTAQSLGAHAPATMAPRAASAFTSRNSAVATAQAYRNSSTYGRYAPVATSPRYQGISPTPYHSPSYSGRTGTYGSYGAVPSRSFGSYPSAWGGGGARYSSPSYSQHFAPSYGGGGYAGGAYHGGTVHSSGTSGGSSEPSGGSAPAVHPGGGGFRGGGGFHGGGHAGGGGGRR